MKIVYRKVGLFLVVILIIAASVIIWLRHTEDNSYKKRGDELIKKIEIFRHDRNRLPNTVTELGLQEPMNEGPYYQKKDSTNYVVFFNISFDNAKVYSSKTKQWKDEH